MNDTQSAESIRTSEQGELQGRRQFLRSLGKWSGAAIIAAVGGAWLGSTQEVRAGGWVNRRGVRGGGWINGGGWVNRAGGWINGGGGGGGWVNRRGVGGGAWINRR